MALAAHIGTADRGRGTTGLSPAQSRKRRRESLTALAFLSPWLVGFCVFFAYPLIAAVYFSFESFNMFNPPKFVGFRNWDYVLFHFSDLATGLHNTLWLVCVVVVLQVVFGLGVALLVTKIKRGGSIFRTLFYLPYLAPPVISTLIFVYLFDAGGPIDSVLSHVGVHSPPLWFNDPTWFKPSLTVLSLWGVGNTMIIFFAALLDVPREHTEAAQLDGCGAVKRFRFVVLPAISPVILFSVVTGVIFALQYYTQALVAGQVASGQILEPGSSLAIGYPQGSSLTVSQLIYELGIVDSNVGPACCLSILLFLMGMVFTLVLLRRKHGFLVGE